MIPLLNQEGVGGGSLVQEGVGGGLLSHCVPFALLPPWFRIGLTSPL